MNTRRTRSRAFTLVELIGVLAVMSILAAVMVPTTLRTLDRTAVKAERAQLRAIGSALSSYVRHAHAMPSNTNWTTVLTSAPYFIDLPVSQLTTNARLVDRRFLIDPSGASRRALLISGLRNGLTLPSVANLNNSTQFDAAWVTATDAVPGGGAGIWSAWANYGEALVIERFNFQPDLTTRPISLNNASATAPMYRVVTPTAPNPLRTALAANTTITLSLYTGDRIELFTPTGTVAAYAFSIGDNGGTFDFNGTTWTPR